VLSTLGMPRVYLDHHAATPLDPRVRAIMLEAAVDAWANPASVHAEGRASRALLERARTQIAAAIEAAPADVVLTAGGTEACNLGLLGVLNGVDLAGSHVVTSAVEHPAVAEPLRELEARGLTVTRLSVPAGAPPTPMQLAAAITPHTRLVALQWVNHETGTIFPLPEYARVCRSAGVPCFVDASQAFGKLPLSVRDLDADLVALASHKIGGPPGAGALWVRRDLSIDSLLRGGGQERGRRAGTPDVLAQLGFGAACELLSERLTALPRMAAVRDALELGLLELGARRNAADGLRTASASNLYFPGWQADALVAALDLEGVAVSAGAACSSGKSEPSPVLLAMHPQETARSTSSLRFSFGVQTNETDYKIAMSCCATVLARPRA
jgi:cysteine desulfurase